MNWEIHHTIHFIKSTRPIPFTYYVRLLVLKFCRANISTNIISEPFVLLWWLIIEQMFNQVPNHAFLWADFNHSLIGKKYWHYWQFASPLLRLLCAKKIWYSSGRLWALVGVRKDSYGLNILDIVKKENWILPSPKNWSLWNTY